MFSKKWLLEEKHLLIYLHCKAWVISVSLWNSQINFPLYSVLSCLIPSFKGVYPWFYLISAAFSNIVSHSYIDYFYFSVSNLFLSSEFFLLLYLLTNFISSSDFDPLHLPTFFLLVWLLSFSSPAGPLLIIQSLCSLSNRSSSQSEFFLFSLFQILDIYHSTFDI